MSRNGDLHGTVIYNTMTKAGEEFVPIEEPQGQGCMSAVSRSTMTCTWAMPASIMVFDMVSRYLRYKGYGVTLVTNFTDVDDKIINRANEDGRSDALDALGRCTSRSIFRGIDKLGVKKADIYPKASE